MNKAHAKPWKQVNIDLESDPHQGLSKPEADLRLTEYGPNVLASKRTVSAFIIFISQFKSPFVLLLAIASAMSIYFGEMLDAIAIAAVLLINAIIGFIMEHQAE